MFVTQMGPFKTTFNNDERWTSEPHDGAVVDYLMERATHFRNGWEPHFESAVMDDAVNNLNATLLVDKRKPRTDKKGDIN